MSLLPTTRTREKQPLSSVDRLRDLLLPEKEDKAAKRKKRKGEIEETLVVIQRRVIRGK